MRKITNLQIVIFFSLLSLILCLAAITNYFLSLLIQSINFKEIILSISFIILLYSYTILIYRLIFIKYMPLKEGDIAENSREEFIYHLYLLFFLILLHPIMRSGFLPVPIMRMFYLALGAKLGDNTYSSGILFDPIFIQAGSNTIIGQASILIPHVIEGSKLAHYPIIIGNNVTIGAQAVIMANVVIEDDAIVSVGAVVTKNTHINKGEIWGGIPAKKIK